MHDSADKAQNFALVQSRNFLKILLSLLQINPPLGVKTGVPVKETVAVEGIMTAAENFIRQSFAIDFQSFQKILP